MLNQALRTMDIDLIMKLGFFVKDLHLNIVRFVLNKTMELGMSCLLLSIGVKVFLRQIWVD